MKTDIHYMRMALKEARKGVGRTSPNPAVGAVVVSAGKIISAGYHRKAGAPHAEVVALNKAGENAKGATIYVTLEPCNHFGRTPPCTHAIINSGISRVVVGMPDPNPTVSGGGNTFLRSRNIDVQCPILEQECRDINRPFIKHIQSGMPWVTLKGGLSLDGKIALANGQSSWITCDKSRQYVHRLRNNADAILVGIGTALTDNPSLTTRLNRGHGKNPLRVIVDGSLRLPVTAKMLTQGSNAATMIFCSPHASQDKQKELEQAGAIIKRIFTGDDGQIDLEMVFRDLGKQQLTSVLVEGGSRIHGSLIKQQLADQANLFIAPVFLGGDALSLIGSLSLDSVQQGYRLHNIKTRRFDNDIMIEGLF